ncbi:P-loop containing nucleoside triphosphate hydrolase protein [Macrolepiota fuliginosa MF-IS2]|uniref:P-loop containing nucleoside triphosphate hydrolase protein n=1 Tax=Macrolepiota fuliginosa MF-IS2 TaxID=1400762 RepID=A0A9P5XHF8_9AGAR|nr:P-loop containing nucleoside triphosphate hydrolase protein [Macrolepiota fuliginosa MF-IS2]
MNPAGIPGSPGFNSDTTGGGGGLFDFSSTITRIFGLSMFASIFTGGGDGVGGGGMKLIVLGMLVEFARRLAQWVYERFRLQYSITAEFSEGDPAYDWIINFITEEKVWRRSKDFRVSAKSSQRRWGISSSGDSKVIDSAEYVPTYDLPQLFWWKRYWIEIKRTKGMMGSITPYGGGGGSTGASIYLTVYTLDMNVLSRLVEEAKKKYYEVSRPHVIVHSVTAHSYGPKFYWNNVKQKPRRPLDSIVLPDATLESLIADVRDFLKMEDWYMTAGIPHRRGYLLYGPPGTGKSSTIHAIAGELKMEIYAISLASHFVDDNFLEQAVSSVPKGSILLIEDIDCAFSREEDEEEGFGVNFPSNMIRGQRQRNRRSAVTLSGLLNILDGVGSEEGKIFFATTNYVDSLDAALMRPGRIDRKVEYKLATKQQASALFTRFYPVKHVTPESLISEEKPALEEEKLVLLEQLNKEFTTEVPEHEFSTAELQGFLLSCKMMPEKAAKEVVAWVADERRQREEKQIRIEAKKRKQVERKERMEVEKFTNTLAKLNGGGTSQDTLVNGREAAPPPTVSRPINGSSGFVVPSTVASQVNGANGVHVNGVNGINGANGTSTINGINGIKVVKANGVHNVKELVAQGA